MHAPHKCCWQLAGNWSFPPRPVFGSNGPATEMLLPQALYGWAVVEATWKALNANLSSGPGSATYMLSNLGSICPLSSVSSSTKSVERLLPHLWLLRVLELISVACLGSHTHTTATGTHVQDWARMSPPHSPRTSDISLSLICPTRP